MTLILIALPISAHGDDSGRTVPFNIPPQALSSALVQFADQGGVQFTAPGTLLQGLKTPGVHGNYAPAAAIATMLRNTGLTYRFIDHRTVAISRPGLNPAQNNPSTHADTAARSGRTELRVSSSHRTSEPMDRVTIQAPEDRRALPLKVHQFVTAVLAPPRNGPLYRWNIPNRWNVSICPVVAGLPKAAGELALQRLSDAAAYVQGATYANAPLIAGKACHPNLYIVASDHPAALLRKWRGVDPRMYVTEFGIPPIERFIQSPRPIRVWYNTGLWCTGSAPVGWGSFARNLDVAGRLPFDLPACSRGNFATPTYGSPWSNITSAIIAIDLHHTKNITTRQMADYIALISLVDVRLDADPGSVPSILQLFGPGTPPQGLTRWDRALVYSVYDTSRESLRTSPGSHQMREIELDMIRLLSQ